jgi:large subunit ribosomal protein L10
MPTQRKIEIVSELTDKMQRSQLALVADYRGMTVAEMKELRTILRANNAELVVAKNTLLTLAARETGREAIEPMLAGPTAVAFVYEDIAKGAKVLNDYIKGSQKFKPRGGLLGNAAIQPDGLEAVTKLPTREQALAGVVGSVAAPVAGVVGVINAAVSNVLYVLQARIDQLGGEAAA